jgi:3-oxoacyl-[acyl-carrier protein] reductase
MSDSVAIVTGPSQGIGQATAIRLARDFSALALVARNRANLEQTAEAVRAASAKSLINDVDCFEPAYHYDPDRGLPADSAVKVLGRARAIPPVDVPGLNGTRES